MCNQTPIDRRLKMKLNTLRYLLPMSTHKGSQLCGASSTLFFIMKEHSQSCIIHYDFTNGIIKHCPTVLFINGQQLGTRTISDSSVGLFQALQSVFTLLNY